MTDAARYMGKAYKKELKGLFTKMIHVTCLAHGLHRVCDFIRLQFTDVDDLIANVKNIYKKSPKRILNFKKVAPNLSLPPKPIITRWGTWVQAAIYYANNLEIIQKIINSLNPEEAVSINIVQKLFKKPTLKENLIYIKSNFSFLPSIINKLQGNVSLCDSMKHISEAKIHISSLNGEIGDLVKKKFETVLHNNIGFKLMENLNNKINYNACENDFGISYTSDEIICFKNAPITSCDFERSFSKFKLILTERRESFTLEKLIHNDYKL